MPPKVAPKSSPARNNNSNDISAYFEKLQDTIKESEQRMLAALNDKCNSIIDSISENKKAIDEASKTATQAYEIAIEHSATLLKLEERISELEKTNDDLKLIETLQEKKISTLQVRLEDQTCRNTRTTLIIRGIPASKEKEKWHETRKSVCTALSKAFKLNYKEVDQMIERIHRRPKSPTDDNNNNDKRQETVIDAKFYDWNDSERILRLSRKYSKTSKIFIDQRYGPDTTWRRNQALAVRKDLKANEEIVSGFVKYPAKLMVKHNAADEHYTLFKDFSDVTILQEEEEEDEH